MTKLQDDIPRDLAATQQGNVHDILIADIVARKDWQVRVKIDSGTVGRYATVYQNGRMPPVKIARVDGTLVLVDGWHRLEALKMNGEQSVAAEVVDLSDHEAQWQAARANLEHGKPLKKRELRNVFRAYLRSGQHRQGRRYKSYRDIASDLSGSVVHGTIRNWMRQDAPSVFRALAVGGEEKPEDFDPLAGGPRHYVGATPFGRAQENLDAALNEARSLSIQERQELITYGRMVLAKIEAVKAWDQTQAMQPVEDNDDF